MSAPDTVPNFNSGKSRVLHPRVLRLLTLCLTGAVAGTGLGLLGRRWSAARVQTASGLETSSFTETGTAQGRASNPPVSGPPLSAAKAGSVAGKAGAGLITVALTADKGVEYWLHLLSAADGSSAEVLAALAESLKDEPAAISLIGGRWAQLDPAGMLTALKRQEPLHRDSSPFATPVSEMQKILVSEWFRQDQAGLIKALDAVPGADQLRPAKDALLQLLAAKDPGKTLQLIANWDLPLRTVPSKVLKPWVQAHPREAMQFLLERKSNVMDVLSGDGASGTLLGIAEAMAGLDPIGALTQPGASHSVLSSTFFDKVMEAWARRDPAAASAWLAGGEVDRLTKYKLGKCLLRVWSQTDPRAATDWADAHLSGAARLRVNEMLIPALASQDPAGAVEFVSGMAPGFMRDKAVEDLTGQLLQDRKKAEALTNFQRLAALTDPALRKAALASAAWPMMKAAPQEFMAWLASPEGSQAPFSSFQAAADFLAQTDGQAAMNWASGLRQEISGEVRNSVLYRWLESGPEAAQAWVAALPPGEERRAGIITATDGLADKLSPAKYAAWLDSLPASDHPAILEGLEKASSLDLKTKTLLQAKYR